MTPHSSTNYANVPIVGKGTPLNLILLLDLSGSMRNPYADTGFPKMKFVAQAANKCLREILYKCLGEPRCCISVIGYGSAKGEATIMLREGWPGDLLGANYQAGKWIDEDDVNAWGGETMMAEALEHALALVDVWFNSNKVREEYRIDPMDCIPPIVINVSDGENTEFERKLLLPHSSRFKTLAAFPEQLTRIEDKGYKMAEQLKRFESNYGHVLLFNIQLSDSARSIMFPTPDMAESQLDVFGKYLFTLSSELPQWMCERADLLLNIESVPKTSRAMVTNLPLPDLAKLLVFGSYIG
jgi:hypothetical protein